MKMNLIRSKNVLKSISLIWLVGIVSSCGVHYKLKPVNFNIKGRLLSEITKENSVIFVHSKNELIQLKGALIVDDKLEAFQVETDQAEFKFYQRIINTYSRKAYFNKKDVLATRDRVKNAVITDTNKLIDDQQFSEANGSSDIIHQVHIYAEKLSQNGNFIQIDLSDIYRMEIFKREANTAIVFAILILGPLLLLFLFLAISCACPHVYLENGASYSYTNTLFTGAVSQELERFDYKLIPDFHPNKSTLNMQIHNEEKEIQHTNVLQLIAAYHDPSIQVLADQRGQLYSISNATSASSAKDQRGVSMHELVAESDGAVYEFDTPSKNGIASSILTFQTTQEAKQAKLVLSLRNSDWAGLIHQEFINALGSHHQKWASKNRTQSGAKQLQEMKEAGIPLIVSVKKNNKWVEIETIQPIGNAEMQSLVVPIDASFLSNGKVEIRIDGAYRFWTLDYAAMDFSAAQEFEIQKLNPTFVSGAPINVLALNVDDHQYLTTSAGSEAISVRFEGLKAEHRTLFVQSKGYYIRQDVQKGKPAWAQLAKISRNNGLARFSQDVFFKYANQFGQLSIR